MKAAFVLQIVYKSANTGQIRSIWIFFLVLADFAPPNIGFPDSLYILHTCINDRRDANILKVII
jgi:hypothetical protein